MMLHYLYIPDYAQKKNALALKFDLQKVCIKYRHLVSQGSLLLPFIEHLTRDKFILSPSLIEKHQNFVVEVFMMS